MIRIRQRKVSMRKPIVLLFIIASLFIVIQGRAQQPLSIQIYFFYAEDCQSCQAILHSYLPTLKTMFPSMEIKTFDVGNPAHYEALGNLEKKFKKSGEELPVVYIGDHLLSGEMEIMEQLNPLLLEYQVKGGAFLP